VVRGDVHLLKLPEGVGHEQRGRRYGVVVQADELLRRSVVLIAPTSRSAAAVAFRPVIEVDRSETQVLVEQVGAVDVRRLGRKVGHLDSVEMWAVDECLRVVPGLR